MLFTIPGAGGSLRNVKIDIDHFGDGALLVSSPSTRRHINLLSKQLGRAWFRFASLRRRSSADTQSDIHQLLLEILDSDSIEGIDVHIGEIEDGELNPFDIGPVLSRRRRPNLSVLTLRGVAIHAAELALFTRSLKPRGYSGGDREPDCWEGLHFWLSKVRLLSGTWARVLDLLRPKSDTHASIERPLGGECVDMSEEEYDKIFGHRFTDSWSSLSLAEHYVRSSMDYDLPNPLHAS
ncbi:hypothetical protein GGR52DRAFT_276229 [Hypoxylon sp. FL1284]|nr:hypothetical protein GGR52DRAFT_276229 [Hypoxylon sp. FL1284]